METLMDNRVISLLDELQPQQHFLRRLAIKEPGRVVLLPVDEIDWLEAAGNYIRIHCGKLTHLYRGTMSELEGKLDPARFARIHRSVIVNIDRIQELQPWFHGEYSVLLRDGTSLRLSRSHRGKLEAILGAW